MACTNRGSDSRRCEAESGSAFARRPSARSDQQEGTGHVINKNITRLHPQGKGGPEGDFLCAENTLNVYHTYHDVTIQNPSIIDLA